ncbi:cytochrome c553 [Stella humosa]|uniref:Cytochrome c553 n=1 Tax=Stella humosa TaxID=94 RepID=A0A3N1KKG8_9PROT|nr:c-type cytochrome [Stella humosa]ROP81321.1 cytochrome c553 [Stella humosa]BBK32670.1 hypothetical protein STHU_33040 [Stella humosa]
MTGAGVRAVLIGLLALGGIVPPAAAADPPPGATSCSGCHAPAGRVAQPSIPPIDGLPASEMVRAMTAFRSSDQPSTVMGRIARGFSDDEIRALAAWLEQKR